MGHEENVCERTEGTAEGLQLPQNAEKFGQESFQTEGITPTKSAEVTYARL